MMGGPRDHGQYFVMERLRAWRKSTDESGLTIMEVLIVLSVTAVLFMSAAGLISGRQNRTAFEQAVREVQSQIQQTINEVAIGYYPNLGNFRCAGSAATGVVITPGSGTGQGTNSGCIFLGKALQFKVLGSDPEKFATFTIAGVQKGRIGDAESGSLADARPLAVAPTNTVNTPDATVVNTLQSGLTTLDMWYDQGGTKRSVGIVAFVASLAPYSGAGATSTLESGAQNVNLVPVYPSGLNTSQRDAAGDINNNLAASPINPTSGLFICFVSGATDQSGLITIGGSGRQLSVTLDVRAGTTCA